MMSPKKPKKIVFRNLNTFEIQRVKGVAMVVQLKTQDQKKMAKAEKE
ncbi:hypothetical protein [Pseudoalteromonas piscicida]|nr:hypothetical protein [Pseudoalteromonas piscicida]WMO15728.1 hypothetical protein NI376_09185 [Pseudoalteromonas piscicida]